MVLPPLEPTWCTNCARLESQGICSKCTPKYSSEPGKLAYQEQSNILLQFIRDQGIEVPRELQKPKTPKLLLDLPEEILAIIVGYVVLVPEQYRNQARWHSDPKYLQLESKGDLPIRKLAKGLSYLLEPTRCCTRLFALALHELPKVNTVFIDTNMRANVLPDDYYSSHDIRHSPTKLDIAQHLTFHEPTRWLWCKLVHLKLCFRLASFKGAGFDAEEHTVVVEEAIDMVAWLKQNQTSLFPSIKSLTAVLQAGDREVRKVRPWQSQGNMTPVEIELLTESLYMLVEQLRKLHGFRVYAWIDRERQSERSWMWCMPSCAVDATKERAEDLARMLLEEEHRDDEFRIV